METMGLSLGIVRFAFPVDLGGVLPITNHTLTVPSVTWTVKCTGIEAALQNCKGYCAQAGWYAVKGNQTKRKPC